MTLDIAKMTASQELSNYRDAGDELGQAGPHGNNFSLVLSGI